MPSGRKVRWHTLIAAALTIGLLWWFLRNLNFREVWSAMRGARAWPIVLAVIVTFQTYVFRAWRWQALLLPIGRARFSTALRTTVIGFTATFLLPGRIGEVLRPYLLARREGFSAAAHRSCTRTWATSLCQTPGGIPARDGMPIFMWPIPTHWRRNSLRVTSNFPSRLKTPTTVCEALSSRTPTAMSCFSVVLGDERQSKWDTFHRTWHSAERDTSGRQYGTIAPTNHDTNSNGSMAKRLKDIKEIKIERPPRAKLSAEESLKRTQEFDKRKERFIASIRKGKG